MVVTFLPYSDYKRSVEVLDDKRLGKQRVEALQLIRAIQQKDNTPTLMKHPACKMWIGYLDALILYYHSCLDEWERRGFKNNMERLSIQGENISYPWWFGWEHLHLSHQASLIRKDTQFYKDKFSTPDYYMSRGYLWPHFYDEKKDEYLVIQNEDPLLDTLFYPVNERGIKKPKKKLPTVKELKEMCKERGIKGYSKLRKDELLQLLDIDTSS